jgi:predicted ATPase
MRRVVLTGGPGAGKTAVLDELRSRGYPTLGDSARLIIANRLRQNQSARPEPSEFADEVLRKDVESYSRCMLQTDLVFYDRGVVDALCMLDEVAPLEQRELKARLMKYAYYPQVFAFPPFSEAQHVHNRLTSWYRRCGYELIEVPRLSVRQRSEYVLRVLGRCDA